MFSFVCKRVYRPKKFLFKGDPTTRVWCSLETPVLIRYLSTTTKCNSFTVSYLIDSCGFAEDKAITISKRVHFDRASKPDSVISLLKNYELPRPLISNMITKYPPLLVTDADKIIKPKIDYIKFLGFCGAKLVKFLLANPYILNYSLEKRIIPNVAFLKGIVTTDKDITTLLSRSSWVLTRNVEKLMTPNIALLRDNGVPESFIKKIVVLKATALAIAPDQFKEIVEETKKMKFDPLQFSFVKGVAVLSQLSEVSWETKISIFKKFGWSEEVFYMTFRKFPVLMEISAKKASHILEFLVNKMGYDPLVIAKCPLILSYSLDKRIIPRCLVIELLISNCLIGKDCNLNAVLAYSEKDFVEKFVTKFQGRIPKVLDVYEDKVKGF